MCVIEWIVGAMAAGLIAGRLVEGEGYTPRDVIITCRRHGRGAVRCRSTGQPVEGRRDERRVPGGRDRGRARRRPVDPRSRAGHQTTEMIPTVEV